MSFDMKNVVDIHVHAGPSVAKRRVDAGDMLLDAQKAGYRGFVSKDHYFPTMMGTDMVTKFLGNGSCEAFGCIVLNNAVGGVNIYAVDAACAMGAKIVFMPTISALNHINHHTKNKFVGAGALKIQEKPIYYLDEQGELKPEVVQVLEFLAQNYPEVTLGTGHGTVAEINKLIDKAVELGLQKILVNHPFFNIDATIDDMVRWADQGAMIELNAVVFDDVVPASHHLPFDIAKEVYNRVGYQRIVVDSDMGQASNVPPTEGLQKFAGLLIEKCGATEEQLKVVMHDNPAWLIGIDQAKNGQTGGDHNG